MEGTGFGPYRLRGLLGAGGMGEVWEAYDTATDRLVALKVLPRNLAADSEFRERFRREAYAASRLTDPHAVPIHTFGEIDGRLYLDMRLIRGGDLREILRRDGALTPERAVAIVEQVADALDDAHGHGLYHRDVKPSNILVAARDFVYLIDFGIARGGSDPTVTRTGAAIGTFAYMAPERLTGGRGDARGDVYALTCVLHECLTGTRPFPGEAVEQQIAGHLSIAPPAPSRIRPGVPTEFDAVVARGMAKHPDDRYPAPGELAAAARRALRTTAPPGARTAWPEPLLDSAESLVDPSGLAPESAPTVSEARRESTDAARHAVTVPDPAGGVPPGYYLGAPPPAPDTPRESKHRREPGRFGVPQRKSVRVAICAVVTLLAITTTVWWIRRDTGLPAWDLAATLSDVGPNPQAFAFDPQAMVVAGKRYVDGGYEPDCSVTVVNPATNAIRSTVTVRTGRRNLTGVAADPAGTYLALFDTQAVTFAAPDTGAVLSTLDLTPVGGSEPPAWDPSARRAIVPIGTSDAIVVDLAERTVAATIRQNSFILAIAVDTGDHSVVELSNSEVLWIDPITVQVTKSVPVRNGMALAVDPRSHIAYVLTTDMTIAAADPASGRTTTVNLDSGFKATSSNRIAVDPISHTLYLTLKRNDQYVMTAIDPDGKRTSRTAVLPADAYPGQGLTVDPATHRLYVLGDGRLYALAIDG
ncbi:serine/threonine-protein kinase [Nocardia yamanashiensis]|uniref:serine/threonine-protein kinase n=1 Tax=Nocardia yamanashiensis TaxID=209247 RepID=UPI001E39F170|nr:serine/threonine-protein kinase [Nocardia yamanashiensis]UGT41237.1 serine/threonine-protein kinase [Nocardia yamanashiensis]